MGCEDIYSKEARESGMSAWESNGKSDEWYTPRYIFDAMGVLFDLDVSAPASGPVHVPCDAWIYERSLETPWSGFIWMNPPFGGRNGLVPWLDKFFSHGNGVALTPDRTSAPWWQCAANKCDAVLFVDGKIKFEMPCGNVGKSPSTGTTLFASGPNGMSSLENAAKSGLGVLMKKMDLA